MDSIITRQKIGKRRHAPKAGYRPAADRSPYIPVLEGRARAPSGPPMGKAPGRSKKKRAGSPSKLGASIALLAARFRGEARLGLRQSFRSFQKKAAGLSRPKLAIGALAGITAVAALSFGIAALIRGPSFPMPTEALLSADDGVQDLLLEYVSPELADGSADSSKDATSLPPAPVTLEMTTYTIRPKDSLASIAKRFGLNIDTLISANGISSSSSVRSGTQLRIPNINGLIYKVKSGDSLAGIAKRFKVDTTKIVDSNDLGTSRLVIGQSLIIPGAKLPQAAVTQALGQRVAWPARGPLSSYFGYRPDPFTGVRRFHAGIDIAVDAGTPVRSAMAGRVSDVGYNANYGNYIIIDHADGFQTLYGHLSSASTVVGSPVEQGAVIGLSGNTGYSTGAHLHFGLFKRSLALNPLKYLK
jgi:murein DD-endopeptidase MepM/ murein hydrolase activator NlpD